MDSSEIVTVDITGRMPVPGLVRSVTERTARLAALLLVATPLAAQTPSAPQPAAPAPPRGVAAAPPAATAATRALAALLDRAASTEPGTYVASGSAFDPIADREPIVIQADALRGPDQTIRAAISLGAQASRAVVTRARVVGVSGPARAVVSDVSGSSPAGVVRAISQVTLPPGEYELQAAMAHTRPGGSVMASLARSRLLVDDLWRGALALSPIVLGDAVAAAPASSAGTPFAFGPTALRPATADRFPQGGELHVAFRIFNWTARPEEKPDLQVEYVFHERTPTSAQFFNKVKPQRLNADTLGERFDPAGGVVNAGMSIPLSAFPFSEFQLTVRVTDNRSKRTASQQSRFVVVP